jgi:hypothetical protein
VAPATTTAIARDFQERVFIAVLLLVSLGKRAIEVCRKRPPIDTDQKSNAAVTMRSLPHRYSIACSPSMQPVNRNSTSSGGVDVTAKTRAAIGRVRV